MPELRPKTEVRYLPGLRDTGPAAGIELPPDQEKFGHLAV